MRDFKKILFPVDFSEVSPKIAPWVLASARKYDAEIHLLFVARNLEHFVGVSVPIVSIEEFQEEVVRGAEASMEEFVDTHFKGYPKCRTHVVLGDAAEEIIRYAERESIDLIIMGTHGRKGIERVLVGSVADRVIKSSPVPVLSINPYRVKET